MPLRCPRCDRPTPEDKPTCQHCGASLGDGQASSPEAPAAGFAAGSPSDCAAVAEQYAAQLRSNESFNADFSPASIAALDLLLDLTEGSEPPADSDDFLFDTRIQKLIWRVGCYVGEVFRRLYDGIWEDNLGQDAFPLSAGVVVQPFDQAAPVFIWVFERVKYGTEKIFPCFERMQVSVEETRRQGRPIDVEELDQLLSKGRVAARPADVEAWVRFSADLRAMQRFEDALRFTEKAIDLSRGSSDAVVARAWHDKAVTLERLGRTAEARDAALYFLNIAPRGLFREEIQDVRSWLAYSAQVGQTSVNLIETVNLINRGAEGASRALETIEVLLKQKPHAGVVWVLKGDAHLTLGELDRAMKSFIKAVELKLDTQALRGLAQCQLKMGHYQQALVTAEQALRLDANNHAAWVIKAGCLRMLGRLEQAMSCLGRSLDIESGYAPAWAEKGWVEDALGCRDDAAKSFQRFRELAGPKYQDQQQNVRQRIREWGSEPQRRRSRPGTLEPKAIAQLIEQGDRLASQGRIGEALRKCAEVLLLDPDNPVALTNKGDYLLSLGETEEALDCFNAALRSNPRYGLALRKKVLALMSLDRTSAALQSCNALLALDPRSVLAHVNKSAALIRLKRLKEALQCSEAGLQIDSSSPQLLYNAALAADRMHRQPLAVRYYDQFLAVAGRGSEEEVALARKRLQVLDAR